MKELTAKQEALCQAYIECGGNQSEAYRRAYDTKNMEAKTIWEAASRLFNDSKVCARVLELQAIHAERHNVTVDTLTNELDAVKDLAMAEKQPAAATSAIMGKARVHGLVVGKKDQKRDLIINIDYKDSLL